MTSISIIIPTFNEAHLLEGCLNELIESCSKLDIKHELIVINDCSTDETTSILKKFEGKIVQLHTSSNTGGAGLPRNLGLDKAKNDYVIFYDIGDAIDLRKVREITQQMTENNISLCICKHIDIGEKNEISEPLNEIFNGNTYITNIKNTPHLIANPFCWSKIYNRKWLDEKNIRFGNIYCGEDKPFTWKAYLNAEVILISKHIMYGHKFYGENINRMLQRNIRLINSIIEIDELVRPIFIEHGMEALYNNRLVNRDISGIILEHTSIRILERNQDLEVSLEILDAWLNSKLMDKSIDNDDINETSLSKIKKYLPRSHSTCMELLSDKQKFNIENMINLYENFILETSKLKFN